ncbi:MAG: biotin/lipoyl-binding protein [bacterium]|nr:biotin/lipoyl-binding protein [bacterium]
MKVVACINDACLEIDLRVDPLREGVFLAEIGGREVLLELTERKPGSLTMAIDDQIGFYEFHSEKGRVHEVVHNNRAYRALIKSPEQEQLERLLEEFGAGIGGGGSETRVMAPMPGKILGVGVAVGDKLELGQVVCVLEAMKMENEITSEVEGKVQSVKVKIGDSVAAGDVILEVEPRV